MEDTVEVFKEPTFNFQAKAVHDRENIGSVLLELIEAVKVWLDLSKEATNLGL